MLTELLLLPRGLLATQVYTPPSPLLTIIDTLMLNRLPTPVATGLPATSLLSLTSLPSLFNHIITGTGYPVAAHVMFPPSVTVYSSGMATIGIAVNKNVAVIPKTNQFHC